MWLCPPGPRRHLRALTRLRGHRSLCSPAPEQRPAVALGSLEVSAPSSQVPSAH